MRLASGQTQPVVKPWNSEKKVAFANQVGEASHLVVVSVAADPARAKRVPDSWLPDNQDYVCDYLQTWIETRTHYELATNNDVLKLHTQCLGPVQFCGKTWPLETTKICWRVLGLTDR